MHGRIFQALLAGLLGALLSGCDDTRPDPAASPAPTPQATSSFDPTSAGTISGQVRWQGDVPKVPELLMRCHPPVAPGKLKPNPFAPMVNTGNRGVANAIVFLRGVEAAKARPWNHAPVQVEFRDLDLHVIQGQHDSRVGFIRRGDTVSMLSREVRLQALEARGAAFFSLRFVEADKPTERRLEHNGVVGLRSATGYFWMCAHLHVAEHPYFARTDGDGRFHLSEVPPGKYQLVCWMPNWNIFRKERDPETSLTMRLIFAAPLELETPIIVDTRGQHTANFQVSTSDFPKNKR